MEAPVSRKQGLQAWTKEHSVMEDTQTINCEPHWPSMFDMAVNQVRCNVPAEQGQALVVEMLEFGKRLYLQAQEEEK